MQKLIILFFALGFVFVSDVRAQTSCATVKNNKAGIAKITNINSELAKDKTCLLKTFTGNITGISYETDETENASSITIQLANGQRFVIEFFEGLPHDCFSEADKSHWKAQLIKGARVTVKAYICGASGNSDLSISSVEFLPLKGRIRKRNNYRSILKIKKPSVLANQRASMFEN